MEKQKGFAITTAAIILSCFVAGMVFEHYAEQKNHPLSQAIELVLSKYGIDYDFSADEK